MTPTLELLTEQAITAWSDWDRACTLLRDRQERDRYRPGPRDLAAQTDARCAAVAALAARLEVPSLVLHRMVVERRHAGATAGCEWTGMPAARVHQHGTTGRGAGDAVQDVVNELTGVDARVDEFPTPNEHRRAS